MAENQAKTISDFLAFVESSTSDDARSTLRTRVTPSFSAALTSADQSRPLDGAILRRWMVRMFLSCSRLSTCRRYLAALHAACSSWRPGEADTLFLPVREALSNIAEPPAAPVADPVALMRRIATIAPDSPDRPTADIALYLFYNPTATLADIISLRRTDPIPDCPQLGDIVTSTAAAPNSSYIFPLGQGRRRPAQIARELLADIHALLRKHGLTAPDAFTRATVTALWIAAAIRCGLTPETIRAVIPTESLPARYAFLTLLDPAPLTADDRLDAICRVADAVTPTATRWYVMHLRAAVTPDDIRDRLRDAAPSLLRATTFYYPTRSVTTREADRTVRRDEPYLPAILFFRLRSDRVTPLFRLIGHLAWCYRQTPEPDAPYSTIAPAEMARFQRHVGQFTADIRMELISSQPPIAVGDTVRIAGGLLEGHAATVTSAARIPDGTPSGAPAFTLRLSSTTTLRFHPLTLPALQLTRIHSKE